MGFRIWIKAFRVPFLTATILPVLLGSVIAWHRMGSFNWLYFLLTLIGASLLHSATNLTNDYFDHKTGNDEANVHPTPFSGGSRVIQDRLLEPRKILYAALISFLIGSVIGLYLNWKLSSNIILILGIIGVFCGFFYTAAPLRIGYRGIGELIVGLCFGPLLVLGSFYVQTEAFSLTALAASIPLGILMALVLYINEFPDYEADKSVNKRTLVVILGKERAIKIYHFLLCLVYIFTLSAIILGTLPIYTLIIFISLPLAFKIYAVSKKNFDRIDELLPANAMTIGLHSFIGLLLTTAFILDRIF